MAFDRLRSRLVDLHNGQKVFAYAQGHSACDDKTFQARLVDVRHDGTPVYAFATECHEYPLTNSTGTNPTVDFVKKDCWPPFGVSRYLRFSLLLSLYPRTAHCFGDTTCPETILVYDDLLGYWGGHFNVDGGEFDIKLECIGTGTGTGTNGSHWKITFSNCITTVSPPVFVNCIWPLDLGGQDLHIPDACCPAQVSAPPDTAFEVHGYTNRTLPARLVDIVPRNGADLRVYATSHSCPPDARCDITDCCGCDVAPFQWSLHVAGIVNGPGPPSPGTLCDCHNGDWTLTLTLDAHDGHTCEWDSEPGPCAGAPPSGMWHLNCDTASGFYTLATQFTAGGGAASYRKAIADWDCMGPNTLTLFFSTGQCSSWPATLTVVPV